MAKQSSPASHTSAGAITMTSFISPYRADRDAVRARCSAGALCSWWWAV